MAEKIELVDTVEHLGIRHHFEDEIADALCNIQHMELNSLNLHEVSLRFRLLREHGLCVSPDDFNRFKDTNGRFNIDIINEPKGLLSLYNAAHLLTHDELELEEAICFARLHLESMTHNLTYPLSDQVKRALYLPLPRTVRRIEALHYMLEYEHEPSYNPIILELAKIDFNILQNRHLKELKDLSEWWQDLYTEVSLDYARDRIVQLYLWAHTMCYEEEYSCARITLTKLSAVVTMMDDTYDVRATLEESRNFNEAIQRWDEKAVCLIPEYLKKFYLRIIISFKEIEDMSQPHEKYKVSYAKESFQILSKKYLQGAEWFHHKYVPTFKEKLEVSFMDSGSPFSIVALLVGLGDMASKEALDWAIGCTDAVKACGELTRYMNDISALKHGNRKQDAANCVQCYIAEHNVTSEVATANISKMMEDAWKTTNKAVLELPTLHAVVRRVVDMTVCLTLIYGKKKDVFTFGNDLDDVIKHVFANPFPI
ncbi:hypothetical protein HU200_066148 [Digitaria exilis]|uniref:Uncharacterized protein n=1 Tax=Digitaria exilis TaxID=1010633 RepID=A0A834ZYQ9_9POAL|nr:hypothetical protein HU200_066148 [Digitaria exilis]